METFKKLMANERGVILVISLLILALLIGAGVGAIVSMQTDFRTSGNLKTGAQALYIADAGVERGKHWLNANLDSGPFPTTVNESFGAGSYSVTISNPSSGQYKIISTGSGPNNSQKVIQAIMKQPGFNPLAAINIDGDGTHADFNDGSGGTGSKIPSFNIDGRDHSADGTSLVSGGDPVSPFAGTESGVNTDITSAEDSLKSRIVKRANACPGPDGCETAGMQFVQDLNLTDKASDCPGTQCYKNLDLSDARLRATARNPGPPITYTTPASPDNRGPFAPITTDDPLVKQLTATESSQLQQSIRDIIDLSNASPASKKNCISGDLIGGSHTFGTASSPMITYIGDPCSDNPTYTAGGRGADLEVKSGATVNGAGILIVPRRLRLRDATFNWSGIVLVLEDGDFRVGNGGSGDNSCGAINGAVILQDDTGNDTKLDIDKVSGTGCSSPNKPFSVNFSRAAINNSLKLLLKQVSWVDRF